MAARKKSTNAEEFLVVVIGASAGGLEACRRILDALPAGNGMAFILVQHLDPNHESMLVDLLASHTSMTVRQAVEGMRIEREHFYVIPPGMYLSVGNDALHLSQPRARHGARLPVDFLLHSLADELGERAVCVILSGTGADGSLGLKSVKEKCGLVIAQDPDEAGFDGMPRSAIMTGAVDLVLPAAKIPEALVNYGRQMARSSTSEESIPQDALHGIIDLLRTTTAYDFTLYKPGTLQRRIERRMAMAAVEICDMDRYLEFLSKDEIERDLLAKDLLINVTNFFRDPAVFDFLEKKTIPELVQRHSPHHSLRIWTAGCSTGEETYSLAIIFHEQITAAKRNIKLQIFASDIDPDAVASAREGLYPETIEAEVSPARLARFFTREEKGYRVLPELRSSVIFTVQDVLTDPPFSRLDMISCRNLLIYLQPEAQAKVVSLFHFALREDGILLLGTTETVGNLGDRFEAISKPERLYRHIGPVRPGEFMVSTFTADALRVPPALIQGATASRQADLAELCHRLVIETYAPAAVLINSKHECLYFLGPTDRYLHVAQGPPTQDLLSMVRRQLRTRLRSTIQQAHKENARIQVTGGRPSRDDEAVSFDIAVQPIQHEGEELFLICFVDVRSADRKQQSAVPPDEFSRIAELQRELETTKMELEGAIHNLEVSNEEQKTLNENAVAINEEFQSTNEELLTSKEEMQSFNEELTALNSQLQETLDRERTVSSDLQNILYSTNVATIFLDMSLNVRFFTPAAKLLFHFITADVGRPLEDLSSLSADDTLLTDARTVLNTAATRERNIDAQNETIYLRRIMPYRTQDDAIAGVVITYTDITEQKRTADALIAAKQQAELANATKSRFLTVASHDLRQPLQTLTLLQGLLERSVQGEAKQKYVAQMGEAIGAMSSMLNALLDINQINAGTVKAQPINFPINDLLAPLKDEFSYHAEARGLALRVVRCGLSVHSDPALLEQIIRNLLSNAIKYTTRGKVLLGCRRRQEMLSIEVWDTGVGIADEELKPIFDEYHQIDNAEHDPSRGLGLGLSIVQRIADLLGNRLSVHSRPGKGTVFSIEVKLAPPATTGLRDVLPIHLGKEPEEVTRPIGTILVVEDDPKLGELLQLFLDTAGHDVVAAPDGMTAMELVARGPVRPDLILADFNLPNGMNGLQMTTELRARLNCEIPAIILTGDISTTTLHDIERQHCIYLSKPVKVGELTRIIERLLTNPQSMARRQDSDPADAVSAPKSRTVCVIDDDSHIREQIRNLLAQEGHTVEEYSNAEDYLDTRCVGQESCLLVDAYLPGMSGIDLLARLSDEGHRMPAIMITGHGDVPMAVQAMKAGALDFIEKPIGSDKLLASVDRALVLSMDVAKLSKMREDAARRVASLTPRQREILNLVLAGQPSKNIAADLGISQRTVENHRATIMKKMGAKSLPELARLALSTE